MQTLDPLLVRILNVLGIKKLNELQQLAANEGLYSDNDSIAIVSQSRTGKSFAGILEIANKHFQRIQEDSNEKIDSIELTIVITPFHASARDLFAVISNYFGWYLKPFLVLEELKKTEFKRVQTLYKPLNYHLGIDAILDGVIPGRIWVDNAEKPRTALIWDKRYSYYFLGDENNDKFNLFSDRG